MHKFFNFSREEFVNFLQQRNCKKFVSNQIFEWVYKKDVSDWYLMTNVSKKIRLDLAKECKIFTLKTDKVDISKDQQTVKFLFELSDGKQHEHTALGYVRIFPSLQICT